MKNKLGLFSIVLLGINTVVGSGIFLIPNKLYRLVGNYSLFVVIIAAFLAISFALCFAECSSKVSENGGAYIYAKKSLGDFVGFEVGFIKWTISMLAWAAMVAAFIKILSTVFPVCNYFLIKDGIAIILIFGLGVVNYLGVNFTKIFNNIMTIMKILPLLIFIILGLFFIKVHNFHLVLNNVKNIKTNFGIAIILIFYAFTGFEAIPIAAEDMLKSKKNLPKAITISILLVSIIYFMFIFNLIGILGIKILSTKIAINKAMFIICGNFGTWFILLAMLVSVGGINVAASFTSPRIAVALSNNKMLPSKVKKMSKHNTPTWAIFLTCFITFIFSSLGSFIVLASISVISRFAQYIPTAIAVIVFRRKESMKNEGDFKIPFGYFVPIFAIMISIWILIQVPVYEVVYGFSGFLIAFPFYFLYRKKNAKK